MVATPPAGRVTVQPLDATRLTDLERILSGACRTCLGLWWRLPPNRLEDGEGPRDALAALVEEGATPGLIAYADGQPAGWASVQPRSAYPLLRDSRAYAPLDATPTWSLACVYVAPEHRGQGVEDRLVQAAAERAREHGATVLEAYPRGRALRAAPGGVNQDQESLYRRAGFEEAARRYPAFPILRLRLRG